MNGMLRLHLKNLCTSTRMGMVDVGFPVYYDQLVSRRFAVKVAGGYKALPEAYTYIKANKEDFANL